MNETTTTLLNQALADVLSNAASAKQFVLDQAPDVAQQLIAYTAISRAAACMAIILVLAVALWLTRRHWEQIKELELEFGVGSTWFFGGCLAAFLLLYSANTLIKATLAPKVFLIEYAADLAKDGVRR